MVYRDSSGRFAPKPPLYPKLDVHGVYRHKDGKFAPNPTAPLLPKKVIPALAKTAVTVTVAEVINAIEQNGFRHVRGKWQVSKGGVMVAGCAIGQGAANLGLNARALYAALNGVIDKNRYDNIGQTIVNLNDSSRLSIPEIVKNVRERFASQLETKITVLPRSNTL